MKESNGLIVIQGAGIAGLTLALAMIRKGIAVKVVEKTQALPQTGAGIWMAPNAMQIFRKLEIADSIAKAGWEIRTLSLEDHRGTNLQITDLAAAGSEFHENTIAIHRARLHRILFEALPAEAVCFSNEITKVTQNDSVVEVEFVRGPNVRAVAAVGADGINSSLATLANISVQKKYSQSSSYRGIALRAVSFGDENLSREIWAPGCRLGFSRISADEQYWYLTFDQDPGRKLSADDAFTHASILFDRHFPRWKNLLASTQRKNILCTDIYDIEPMSEWSRDRILLIGDAAHATTPNLGQGGAMAVEDAYCLADLLAGKSDIPSAFEAFQQIRREKVDWTVHTSRRVGQVCHLENRFAIATRNFIFRCVPSSLAQKQLHKIYSLSETNAGKSDREMPDLVR